MQTATLGERIAAYRKSKGLTQRQLAAQLGISDKSVSKWERDITCPDVMILPALAEALGVSVVILLDPTPSHVCSARLSLERYLMGEYGYTVPDLHPAGERAVLLLDAPMADDATHGVALTGHVGEAAAQALYGDTEPLGWRLYREGGTLGVCYVSSVPLAPPCDALAPLTDELEGLRLGRYELHRYLLTEFSKKVYAMIACESLAAIAMTREFNQKYFFTALAYASPAVLHTLDRRLREGSLRLLFVGPPHVSWLGRGVGGKLYDFPELRTLLHALREE